jgi:hypothetical protein
LLDQVELAPGASCLDAACGSGDTMRLMAQRVGPAGEVIGIDVDAERGLRALDTLHAAGHQQCTFAFVDPTTNTAIPGSPFDVVFARLPLLRHSDPTTIASRLWAAVAPAGHLIIQDYDTRTIDVAPSLPAIAQYRRVLSETTAAAGRTIQHGHQLPLTFADAGIGPPDGTDVAGLLSPLSHLGPELTWICRAVLPTAVSFGITTQARGHGWLNQLDRAVAQHPNHIALWPLLIGVWKQKPAATESAPCDEHPPNGTC